MAVTNEDSDKSNIIQFAKLEFNNYVNGYGSVREFSSYYEFCLVEDYEELYDDFCCQSIQLNEVFVQLLEIKNQVMLVSIEFNKEKFSLLNVANWLHLNQVSLFEEKQQKIIINDAGGVAEGIRFKGNTLVLYRKGKERINLNVSVFPEITEIYQVHLQQVNTSKCTKVKDIDKR